MVSGKTLKGLDLAKQTCWKSLGCAPSMREVCTKCERSGIWISKSMIEDIENIECVRESSISIASPLVTYFSSTKSLEGESISSTSRYIEKDGSSIFSS